MKIADVVVRRLVVAIVVLGAVLSMSRRAEAADEASTPAPEPSQTHISLSALMTYGTFVTLPVMRGGLGIEGRMRFLSGHALFMFGRTENGLGAHRIEIGANLMTPMDWFGDWFRITVGPHVGYAMLVRTTEKNAFVNALFGDIASFAIGAHATIEVSFPVADRTRVFVAARVMGEIYSKRNGWEIGPTVGVHF
jgi:hypothetical protein